MGARNQTGGWFLSKGMPGGGIYKFLEMFECYAAKFPVMLW